MCVCLCVCVSVCVWTFTSEDTDGGCLIEGARAPPGLSPHQEEAHRPSIDETSRNVLFNIDFLFFILV